MMTTPFHSSTLVKRRLTPPNARSALRMTSSLMPSSCATATAAVAEQHRELRLAVVMNDVGQANVGLRVFAVSENAAVFQSADQRLHHRMVGAHHREAVERNVLGKGAEGLLH